MVCASEVDIAEAYEAGRLAVDKAVRGESGYMISLERMPGQKYHCTMGTVALGKVANARRTVPDEFINKDGNDVTPEFVEWLRPLLKPELPQYARLKRVLVAKRLG
jgi:6-phosphofructokinase 1